MTLSELFQLTCKYLLLPASKIWSDRDDYLEPRKQIRKKFISGEVNLDRFINLCSNHLILPSITLKFQNNNLLDLFPIEYKNHLLEILEINRKRNREILQQIDEINNVLEEENIQSVYLKGAANLLDNLYSDIGERMIGDIDILVKDKDFLKTAEIILKIGYKNDLKIYDKINTLKDYPRLYKPDVPADIEIHRIPVRPEYSKKFNSKLIFKEKLEIENGTNCFVPSNRHKLIHTFIHSQLSDKGIRYKSITLRDLYDFYLISKRVDPINTLDIIEEKSKARIFFDYTSFLLNESLNVSFLKNKKSKKFALRHKWFLNHPKSHHIYIQSLKFYDLITQRILKALISKSVYGNLFVRISDPHWWKNRFWPGIKSYFS